MNMQAWLKQQQEKAAQQFSESTKSSFENLPDGRYIAKLTSASLGESKSSGRPQIAWGWTILEGEQKGNVTRDYDGLDRDDAFVWLGRKLSRLGVDPTTVKITQIESILDELVEQMIVARVRLRTKGEFQNLIIERVIEDYEPGMYGDEESDSGQGGDNSDAAEEDQVELQEGMKVSYTWRRKELEGVVKSINEAEGVCVIETDGAENDVEIDKITGVVEEGVDG